MAPFSLPEVVSLTSQSASSSSPPRLTHQNAVILDTRGAVDCPAEPVGSHIPPGLKESIHKAIQHHVKKYACQLEASLCNQIAGGLSEAIDFTLNIIEQSFAETHPIQHSSHIVAPAATYSDSSSSLIHMPGAWKQSRSQLEKRPPKCHAPDPLPPRVVVILLFLFSMVTLFSLATAIDIAHQLLPPDSFLGVTVIITLQRSCAKLVVRFQQRPAIAASCPDKKSGQPCNAKPKLRSVEIPSMVTLS
ncbi:hypothetical protein EV401DRAFT_1894912 [Pisolithus croceorrhizus]|nr:hypothetical protein EV401DRAFT_1894912 [Pisolithus croceorrhizus]